VLKEKRRQRAPIGKLLIENPMVNLDTMVLPQTLLEKSLDKRVSLLLKDGRIMEGKFVGFDEYMNMVLEETVENNVAGEEQRRLGMVVLRGNNVVSISIL
jgi:small nuclear ribonucleoprotein